MTRNIEITDYAARSHSGPPSRLGTRYDATRFLPEAGNTVVCHLDFNAPAHQAVLEARARMQALPGAEQFLYTPVDSLHMTVFEGVIETRRTPDAWPEGLDREAPIARLTEVLSDRLAHFPPPPRFAVRAVGIRPSGLILEGATAEDAAHMRAWREALTEPFGYRHEEHDAYRHHMTFAYPTGWITDADLPVWEAELPAILEDLVEAAPVIPLTAPAFCWFNDMTRFEELLILGA